MALTFAVELCTVGGAFLPRGGTSLSAVRPSTAIRSALLRRGEQRGNAFHGLNGGQRLEDVVGAHHVRSFQQCRLLLRILGGQPSVGAVVDRPAAEGVFDGQMRRNPARPAGQIGAKLRLPCVRAPVHLPVFHAGALAPFQSLGPVALLLSGGHGAAAQRGCLLRRDPQPQAAPAQRLQLSVEPCQTLPRLLRRVGKAIGVENQRAEPRVVRGIGHVPAVVQQEVQSPARVGMEAARPAVGAEDPRLIHGFPGMGRAPRTLQLRRIQPVRAAAILIILHRPGTKVIRHVLLFSCQKKAISRAQPRKPPPVTICTAPPDSRVSKS